VTFRNWGPRWAGPAGSRVQASSQQDRPDRRRGDPDLELQQLPADPLVPPAWVLPAEADDEVPDIGIRSPAVRGDPSSDGSTSSGRVPDASGAGSPAALRTRTSCSSSSPCSPPPGRPGRDG